MAGKKIHNDVKWIAKRFGIKYCSFQDFANKISWDSLLNYNSFVPSDDFMKYFRHKFDIMTVHFNYGTDAIWYRPKSVQFNIENKIYIKDLGVWTIVELGEKEIWVE